MADAPNERIVEIAESLSEAMKNAILLDDLAMVPEPMFLDLCRASLAWTRAADYGHDGAVRPYRRELRRKGKEVRDYLKGKP